MWFDEKDGFEKASNLGYFLRFVNKVTEEFKDEVKYFITINEPNVYTAMGYISGEWPPQLRRPVKALQVYRNLAKAHRYSYSLMKKLKPELQIGIALNMTNSQPKRPNSFIDKTVARAADYGWNWWFLNRIKRHQDFVGVNYYRTQYYENFKQSESKDAPQNDLGWHMEPGGIAEVITKAWLRYHKPVMVTENGLADMEDKDRQWWIKETMLALIKSRKAGVDLIGYMHWSLLDNFEWASGWWPKFGLIAVDRENGMKRTVRPSAKWWAHQLKKLRDED
jgi:beta-glucosidase